MRDVIITSILEEFDQENRFKEKIAATNIGNAVGTKSNDHFFIISTNTRKPVEKFILFCKSESKTRFLLTKLLPNCRFFIRY